MDGKGDQFYKLQKEMSRNLRLQGDYETSQEASMLALKKARKLFLVLAIMAISAVSFILIFMPLIAYVQYHDVVALWDKYKSPGTPSGFEVAVSIKFPFMAKLFFHQGSAFPDALYVITRVPVYRQAFMSQDTPAKNMAVLYGNELWGLHASDPSKESMTTALNIICATTWAQSAGITECEPACPPGQGHYASDYLSSGLSMGVTGAMLLAPLAPVGPILGFVIGAAAGAGSQGAFASQSSGCQT